MVLFIGDTPVSYTHLDVYKRQTVCDFHSLSLTKSEIRSHLAHVSSAQLSDVLSTTHRWVISNFTSSHVTYFIAYRVNLSMS